jgi:hypothetical protein
MNDRLAQELAAMVAEDQRLRANIEDLDDDCLMEMSRVDYANTARLEQIIDEHGWPGKTLVGERGAHDAWLLVQHAGHRLDLMQRALGLLREAVARGEAEAKQLAYLDDRVRMCEGRPQRYGTQRRSTAGGPVRLWPIEDEEQVDVRRAEVGLPPLAR